MSVVWSMTSLESGRFTPGERSSEMSDLASNFNQLRSRGQGYLEVRFPERPFPQLTLGFRDDYAVIHLFTDEESVSLLVGDGTLPSDTSVEVPILDDLTEFTGDFALSVDSAWDTVRNFTQERTLEELGEWCEL
ncbi:hypothetical protein ACIQVK_16445 [Streptomyces sp. NPDC090493]|uniref:hypothetical protein n=1 Tax=Streptomyces sp. NPDC090493 TaxID=3365964 RepID=UPI0037F1A570